MSQHGNVNVGLSDHQFILQEENTKNSKKYNCSGPPAFKSQRAVYQSNQKLLCHYQHSENQLNS